MAYDVGSEIAFLRGDYDEAYRYAVIADETIVVCVPSEQSAMAQAALRHNVGYALLGRSRYEEAIAPLQEGVDALELCGAATVHAHMNLALARIAVGDLDATEKHLNIVEASLEPNCEWLRK